jgi:hypothetical protein
MFLGKTIIKAITLAMMIFSTSAFALDDAVNTGRFNNIAIDGYDTVAYFIQNRAVEGDKAHKVKWRNAYWHFDTKENKALFEANPEKYAPQYGGWCAFAMADGGSTARIDPEAFDIYEGKLYLNYNKRVQGFWLEDKLNFIKKADGFYPIETNVKSFIK